MEKVNKKKNKITIIVIVILILIILGLVACVLKGKISFKSNAKGESEIVKDPAAVYKATVDAYGDAVTHTISEYMTSHDGTVPTWEDIEASIPTLSNKVSCDSHINYNGTVYLENCTVEGLKYNGKYTYGKKLPDPIKSNQKWYIYSYKYNEETSGYDITNYEHTPQETFYKLIDTYNCVKDNCKGYDVNKLTHQAIIYDENYYFLYNFDTHKKETIELGSVMYPYMHFINSNKDTYGINVQDDNHKTAIYNLKSKKYVTEFIYSNVSNYNVNELLDNNYFAAYKEDGTSYTIYILNSDGSIKKTIKDGVNINSSTLGNNIIYTITGHVSSGQARLYNSAFEPLLPDDVYYYYAFNTDNTITVSDMDDMKSYAIYNYQGEKLYESKKYPKIVKIVKDYVAILDDEDNLKLIDLKENEVTNWAKITSEYQLHPMISGWHTENGKNGIYIVVENRNIPYGTEGAGLEYYYIPSTKESGVIKTVGVGGYAKPVLYLYPTKKTKVTVTFENASLLTTTYPKYNRSWQVYAYPNGDLYDMNLKYYYGLYWEELGSSKIDFSEGFYVNKEKAITFLDNITEKIGFTRREANEFIMYWLPILEKNEHNLVYFELTESRNNYNKIKINPTPDSLLRVAIHVKKVSGKVAIKEQNIETFNRHGFSAVEWGGVIH